MCLPQRKWQCPVQPQYLQGHLHDPPGKLLCVFYSGHLGCLRQLRAQREHKRSVFTILFSGLWCNYQCLVQRQHHLGGGSVNLLHIVRWHMHTPTCLGTDAHSGEGIVARCKALPFVRAEGMRL